MSAATPAIIPRTSGAIDHSREQMARDHPVAAQARRPGNDSQAIDQLAANFISLMASKSCTPPPTRLVV